MIKKHDHLINIPIEKMGQRVDNFLLTYLKKVPRSLVYKLLRRKKIRVNGQRTDPSYRLLQQDVIAIPRGLLDGALVRPTSPRHDQVSWLESCILFEDDDMIILDKPSGIAVHAGVGVAHGIIEMLRALREDPAWVPAHRLDRDTSGCLVIAKHYTALKALHQLFRERSVHKTYHALLCGPWSWGDHYKVVVGLDKVRQQGRRQVVVDACGRETITDFYVLNQNSRPEGDLTFVKVVPKTGHMHQIRVHARFLKCPIAGDHKYGDRLSLKQSEQCGLKRLFLHASSICFDQPSSHQRIEVTAPWPHHLRDLLMKIFRE